MSADNKEKKVRDRTKDETGKYNDPELEAEEEQDRREGRSKRGKESKNKDTRVKVFVRGRHVGYEGGRKSRRKTKRHRRKTKRRRRKTTHRRKHRVKRRRKTTRKKRGRGIGPSKMAKGATAALAASAAMGQGMGHGISPSKGTAAAVNHFKTVACSDFHIGDVVPHSEDHGQPTEHYRPVLRAALAKKRTCKRTGQSMRQPKPKKKAGESGRQFKIVNRRRRSTWRRGIKGSPGALYEDDGGGGNAERPWE